MNRETRNVLLVVGAVLGGLLLIGLLFSGRPSDAIVASVTAPEEEVTAEAPDEEAPAETAEAPAETETAAPTETAAAPEEEAAEEAAAAPEEEAPTEEAAVAPTEEASTEETPAEEAAVVPEEEAPAEEAPAEEVAAAPAEEAPAEEMETAEAADGDAGGEELALAGDPEAGERTFRQCQACHRIGEGAQNMVGPYLTGVVGRPIASVEGFNYSASLEALGEEGRSWTPDELRGFLADPQGYVPGTMMIYAGVRNEDDLENVIAYLATFEE